MVAAMVMVELVEKEFGELERDGKCKLKEK
jgi:hypothetical protein